MAHSHEGEHDPRFDHDCENCTFLGRMGPADVYACWQGGDLPTVTLRVGDKPEEYRSGVHFFAQLTPELQHAARNWMAQDPDIAAILNILKDAGGELHVEHLEHRFQQGEGRDPA